MARAESDRKKACCLVSEMLEETGLDRQTARHLRRQILEGVVMLCQWQLERMDGPTRPTPAGKARKVTVE